MSNCVEKLPHTCGSSDGMQVFEEDGKYTGFCFACETYVPDPYGDGEKRPPKTFRTKSKEEIRKEIEEIQELGSCDIESRKLRKSSLDYFQIKVGMSTSDGITPSLLFYPYTRDGELLGYKANLLNPKKMWWIGLGKDPDLFGWEQAVKTGAKRLIITEGEKDAAALRRILELYTKEQYVSNMPAVCSLPNGASAAAKDISRLASKIRKNFKEVVLCFDSDAAGKMATEEVLKIFPSALSVDLPAKDVCDCMEQGLGKVAFAKVTFSASVQKNTRLVLGSQLIEAGRTPPMWGAPYPWEGLTALTRGIRTGETIYIGAGVKMGKSELLNALAEHCITQLNWKVFLAKPEEANRKTYQLLVGKAAGKIFHDPKVPFDYAAYDKYAPLIGDNVVLVNLYQHLGWETLKGDIYDAAAMGCKAVFIDPITNLTNTLGAAEANEALVKIAAELSAMALDLNIVIFIFCHLKAPTTGEPHERGGEILSTQFAGSRAMMRSCHYMIGLEGDKSQFREEKERSGGVIKVERSIYERNRRDIVLLEDREFGEVGRIPLYWDINTGLFNEVKHG